jgi:D-beta-D-heptose 7-phosphate kinase/D-beta-D-heptose 1-phosphate adenosyltransferase
MFHDLSLVSQNLENGFGNRRVLVLGDLMLDRSLWGEVNRISPEAPVPVVRFVRQTESLGGAGNVALNLARLGLDVVMGGFVGDDDNGAIVVRLLREAGIDTRAVRQVSGRPTITKTRIIGGRHQMLRLDVEDLTPMPVSAPDDLSAALCSEFDAGLAAVILSDYKKGTLTASLCRRVIDEARRRGIPVLVDPKGRDYQKYHGATVLSPNRAELEEAAGVAGDDLPALLAAGQELCKALHIDFLTVTLSEHGIALVEPSRIEHFPAVAREVYDVSGAGDTVIATLTAALVAGLSRADGIRLANLAAGVVVGKFGTVPVEKAELLDSVAGQQRAQQADKVCSLEAAIERAASWRAQRQRIVFTNGCFDILHAGHVTYLERARQEGQRLVVGLNSDRSVRGLKGESRPIIPEADRARLLAALASVDAVVLFEEDTPLNLITALRPDVLVKGGDYPEDRMVGAREVRGWGGKVVAVPFIDGRSTSSIVKKISRSFVKAGGQEFSG